ncbi:alpha-lytic protease prodomain-containing protein [Actinosynnema sp. NPDC023587]|uniref:alpha-lytic protease prodomain-containing protein n=1 Tax=Actinosynnema sp. NPDC023587 TaxID=3154695 RepID=UPI0033D96EEB
MTRRIAAAVAVTVLSAAGVAAALTTTATAGPPTAPQEDGVIAAMARDFKITPDQARTRIDREAKAATTEQTLKAKLGTGYAGSWLNGDASEFTVAVTSQAQIQAVKDAGATPKVVKLSQIQLDTLKSKLDANKNAPKDVPAWYVDVQSNSVVVLARNTDSAKAFVQASGVNAADVRIEKSDENPRALIDVIGGNAYYMGGGGRCSVGFSVNGGFVTAGHCGKTGSSTTQPSGTFAGSTFPGRDYAWVRVNSGNTMRGLVNRYPGTVPVKGSTEAAVGASVCRSGSTTGWHCGTIQQKNTSVTYPEGTISGVTRTNACAEPGDSGGSWLSGDQAQGVTSGGSGNCSSGGTTYYQPVNPILQAYGLQLVIDGGGTPTTGPTTTTSNPGGGTSWQPGVQYAAGTTVTYSGVGYRCLQGHKSQTGWDPPVVPALWSRVG